MDCSQVHSHFLEKNVSGTYNSRIPCHSCTAGTPPMPEIVADCLFHAPLCCFLLLSNTGMEESQSLGPDPSLPRAREADEQGACNQWESVCCRFAADAAAINLHDNFRW